MTNVEALDAVYDDGLLDFVKNVEVDDLEDSRLRELVLRASSYIAALEHYFDQVERNLDDVN